MPRQIQQKSKSHRIIPPVSSIMKSDMEPRKAHVGISEQLESKYSAEKARQQMLRDRIWRRYFE
jgi:hypothetical protein